MSNVSCSHKWSYLAMFSQIRKSYARLHFYFLLFRNKMAVKKIVKKSPVMAEKKPVVTVETKKVSSKDECCGSGKGNCMQGSHLMLWALLVINTILLLVVVLKPSAKDVEVMKAWGKDNYAVMEQIFSLEQFRNQQKAGLEQALAQFNTPAANANEQPNVPVDANAAATEVKATETK